MWCRCRSLAHSGTCPSGTRVFLAGEFAPSRLGLLSNQDRVERNRHFPPSCGTKRPLHMEVSSDCITLHVVRRTSGSSSRWPFTLYHAFNEPLSAPFPLRCMEGFCAAWVSLRQWSIVIVFQEMASLWDAKVMSLWPRSPLGALGSFGALTTGVCSNGCVAFACSPRKGHEFRTSWLVQPNCLALSGTVGTRALDSSGCSRRYPRAVSQSRCDASMDAGPLPVSWRHPTNNHLALTLGR